MDQRPPPHRLYRIVPVRTAPRADELPAHEGPDRRSAVVLDGPTALALALARQRACREALQERPAGSFGPAAPRRRNGQLPASTFGPADLADDEEIT